MPTFSALSREDVNVFFDQLENIAEIYGWSERQTLETALVSLKANTHAWAMELDCDQKMNYQKFKKLAIETFEKSVPSWLRSKKLLEVQQHPGQDSQDFAAALRKVLLMLQAPSEAMLSAYLCRLNEKLAQMVAMHEPQSFEEAVRMAKKFEPIVTSATGNWADRGSQRESTYRQDKPRTTLWSKGSREDRNWWVKSENTQWPNSPSVNETRNNANYREWEGATLRRQVLIKVDTALITLPLLVPCGDTEIYWQSPSSY